MKKIVSILLIALIAISCLPLAGCGSASLTYYTKEEFFLNFSMIRDKYDFELSEEQFRSEIFNGTSRDALVCCVDLRSTKEGDTVEIPEEYEGKKVAGVISDSEMTLKVKGSLPESLGFVYGCKFEPGDEGFTFPPNLTCVYDSFNYSENIKELEFNEPVKMIEGSFDHSAAERVIFNSDVSGINKSFDYCKNLESVVFDKTAHSIKGSFTECKELSRVEFTGAMDDIEGSFKGCKSLEDVEIKDSASKVSDSFTGYYLDRERINNEMTVKVKAGETSTSKDNSIPSNPKIMIDWVKYDSENSREDHTYYYPLESCVELPYGAVNTDEADLLVIINEDSNSVGSWVDSKTNEKVKDAIIREFVFSIYRLDNNRLIDREDDTHTDPIGQNESETSTPLSNNDLMTSLKEYLESVIK